MTEKLEKLEKTEKAVKAEKAEKPAKAEKAEKGEKTEKAEKAERKSRAKVESPAKELVNVEFLVDEKGDLSVKLGGCDVGLANLIVARILDDKSVGFAAVEYDHPTSRVPVLKVTAKNPKKSVEHALAMVLKDLESLKVGKH